MRFSTSIFTTSDEVEAAIAGGGARSPGQRSKLDRRSSSGSVTADCIASRRWEAGTKGKHEWLRIRNRNRGMTRGFASRAPNAAIVAPVHPAIVWVNKQEIAALAAAIGMDVERV